MAALSSSTVVATAPHSSKQSQDTVWTTRRKRGILWSSTHKLDQISDAALSNSNFDARARSGHGRRRQEQDLKKDNNSKKAWE